jgi:hypothetical protein
MYEVTHSTNPNHVYTFAARNHWAAADRLYLNCGFREVKLPASLAEPDYWILATPSGCFVTVRKVA